MPRRPMSQLSRIFLVCFDDFGGSPEGAFARTFTEVCPILLSFAGFGSASMNFRFLADSGIPARNAAICCCCADRSAAARTSSGRSGVGSSSSSSSASPSFSDACLSRGCLLGLDFVCAASFSSRCFRLARSLSACCLSVSATLLSAYLAAPRAVVAETASGAPSSLSEASPSEDASMSALGAGSSITDSSSSKRLWMGAIISVGTKETLVRASFWWPLVASVARIA